MVHVLLVSYGIGLRYRSMSYFRNHYKWHSGYSKTVCQLILWCHCNGNMILWVCIPFICFLWNWLRIYVYDKTTNEWLLPSIDLTFKIQQSCLPILWCHCNGNTILWLCTNQFCQTDILPCDLKFSVWAFCYWFTLAGARHASTEITASTRVLGSLGSSLTRQPHLLLQSSTFRKLYIYSVT